MKCRHAPAHHAGARTAPPVLVASLVHRRRYALGPRAGSSRFRRHCHCAQGAAPRVQEATQRLDREARCNARLSKRTGRAEAALAAEAEQAQDELAAARLDLAACEARLREALQSRDAQLAAAEAQTLGLRGRVAALEEETARLEAARGAREKELTAAAEERLHLELREQQLRYERRLQVWRVHARAPLSSACVRRRRAVPRCADSRGGEP